MISPPPLDRVARRADRWIYIVRAVRRDALPDALAKAEEEYFALFPERDAETKEQAAASREVAVALVKVMRPDRIDALFDVVVSGYSYSIDVSITMRRAADR